MTAGHYDDPEYYSHAYRARTADIDYYRRLALERGGPVLEYGVGNGRVALALARAGVAVVGVDTSKFMLDDFRRRLASEPKQVRTRVKLRRADMRRARFDEPFPLVFAPFNVVLHLYTLEDISLFLERVRAHLAPGGCFAFDFSLPRPEDMILDPERWYGAPRFRHPTTGKLVRYAERFDYDRETQILHMTFRFTPLDGSPPWETPLAHRQFFPREMEALLRHHGFSDLVFLDDFSERRAGPDTDTMVVECKNRRVRAASKRRRPRAQS